MMRDHSSFLPPPLRRGDCLGLCCPAGPVRNREQVQAGIRLIQDLGFRVKLAGQMVADAGYLAGTDEERLAWFHRLWADEEVKAVVAIRGGFGCLRIVSALDWPLLQRYPKFLVGFSDVTVLLNALWLETGMIGLHGPVLTSLARSEQASIMTLFASLCGDFSVPIQPSAMEVLRGGTGQGILIGGNLTTLVHMLGTRWQGDWAGKILFVEDTNEALYRLDRMLTQLHLAGHLQQLAGLILGTFDVGDSSLDSLRLQESLWQRVLELVGPGFPVWGNFPVGHLAQNHTLPLGMEGVMDSSTGSVRFIPPQ